jgi:predicted small secreted protein
MHSAYAWVHTPNQTSTGQELFMNKAAAVVVSVVAAGFLLAACSADAVTGSDISSSINGTIGNGSQNSGLAARVRCEVSASRSKVSVDGNNLRPLNGVFTARIQSGSHTATAGALQAMGDEVEFDFDSNANDIAEGATAIARNFIQVSAGADVTGEILNPAGAVVASGTAECLVR